MLIFILSLAMAGDFKEIKPGMTESQVTSLVGKPTENHEWIFSHRMWIYRVADFGVQFDESHKVVGIIPNVKQIGQELLTAAEDLTISAKKSVK